MSDWISMEEQKPEPYRHVIFYDADFDLIMFGYKSDEDWFYDSDCGGSYSGVTHWMPIPERPKVKRKRTAGHRSASAWFSVDDTLPYVQYDEPSIKVWVYIPGLGVGRGKYVENSSGEHLWVPEPGYEQISDEYYGENGSLVGVTHWMPYTNVGPIPDKPNVTKERK